ncbi:MAG: KAP family NTPase [Fibrobacterales bacterium]
MSNSNKHIEDYLNNHYLERPNPDFAVLITGDWGRGKTYFIKKCLEFNKQRIDNLTGEKGPVVIYVSLFGVQSKNEVDDRIKETLHPILTSEKLKLTLSGTKLVSKIAATYKGVQVINPLIDETFAFVDGLKEQLTKNKLCVLVFDDVERADIPMPQLLGYINQYVEHEHLHCILLAEHEKWEEACEKQKDHSTPFKLSSVKEKVIGKEFKIRTTPHEVLDSWLDLENKESPLGDKCIEILKPHKKGILQIFDNSKKNNFRSLKHALLEFQRFKHILTDSDKPSPITADDVFANETYMPFLVMEFFAYQYALYIGDLKVKDILYSNTLGGLPREKYAQVMGAANKKEKLSPNEDPLNNTYYEFRKKYDGAFAESLSIETWKEWFEEGTLSRESLLEEINIHNSFATSIGKLLGRIYQWWNLKDQDFIEILQEIKEEYTSHNVTSPDTILTTFEYLYKIRLKGLLPVFTEPLEIYFEDYIRQIISDDKIALSEHKEGEYQFKTFQDIEDYKSLKESHSKLSTMLSDHYREKLVLEKDSLFTETCTSLEGFVEWLKHSTSETLGVAKFENVTPQQFIDQYLEIPNHLKDELNSHMQHRYRELIEVHHKQLDIPFLETLIEEASIRIEQVEYITPSIDGLSRLSNTISDVLKQYTSQKTEESK